ncbi:hypothetical protein [Psychrobacter phenylpyruvicus]|uniref:Uncharacterized protein n=1 Tax=Psychrobacter phenylpyruvicus TaxID=29432 RepID=A0A379LJT5_9GAMM|nr:hypothetical protein [Psychrobacter phenylpyruvicus]SUD90157.1 Uncharacterised protein [Psychrobacter phenylpyruvicus]
MSAYASTNSNATTTNNPATTTFINSSTTSTNNHTADTANAVSSDNELADQSIEDLKQGIADKHPLNYFILAAKLFNEGSFDEAVKWYYVGQIRFRAYLEANPDLEQSDDPALFYALRYSLGTPINQYAGQNVDNWARLIEEAYKWHSDNPNGFTPKSSHKQIYQEIESGMLELRDYVLENKEEIRRQRAENGLNNSH